jgi:D-alanyl-D-alanine carboxypeptidase/D-alanyl-D-alanine-endopeptidase (penicillin-binding protein 4)
MMHRLRLFAVTGSVFVSSLLLVSSPPAHASSVTPTLAARITKALHGSTARHADYRVDIGGVQAVAHDSTHTSAPASNQKLFTLITLLQILGPEFRYATTVSGTSAVEANGTLHGNLVLRGSGDPSLHVADLGSLAKRLHSGGLRHVTGRLIVDDSRYSHATLAPGWKRAFIPVETGTVDAFTIDDNQWRGGVAFNKDPTIDNAALWRTQLRRAHITVAGKTTIARSPKSLVRLATHRSPDLAAIVDNTLTNSVNFNAEMMLREAGAQRSGIGTAATGVAAERAVAHKLNLPLGIVHDGSGLSYRDRESPATIVTWLEKLKTLPIYDTVYFALPLGCDTGTLAGRLCGPNVRGKVRAKTGTLDHNSVLSGYVTTKSGHAATFSFMMSGYRDANINKVLNGVNAAVNVIARYG